MSNVLAPISTDLAFFGRIALMKLKERLVITGLGRRNYSGAAASPGDEIEIPNIQIAGSAQVRSVGGAATASDVSAAKRKVQMQQLYYGASVDNLETLFSSIDLQEEIASQLAFGVAQKADSLVAGLFNEIPYEVVPLDGTAAFNSTDKVKRINEARKQLMLNKSPMDNLALVVGPSEAYNLRQLDQLTVFSNAGDANTLRNGGLGSIFGFEVYESQQIAQAAATGTADGAGAVNGAHAFGATSLAVNALGTGTIAKGTTFSIDSGAAAGRYVVTADATITTNAATLSIYPALRGAAAGGEVVTITLHTQASSQAIAFHPDAILVLTRPPAPLQGGVVSETVADEQTGLVLRVSLKSSLLGGAGSAFTTEIVADLVFGAKVVDQERAVRITGQV